MGKVFSMLCVFSALGLASPGCGYDRPPAILEVDVIPPAEEGQATHAVRVVVEDDRGVKDVALVMRAGSDGYDTFIPMSSVADGLWSVTLPGAIGDRPFYYYIEATDIFDQRSRAPGDAPERVFSFEPEHHPSPPWML